MKTAVALAHDHSHSPQGTGAEVNNAVQFLRGAIIGEKFGVRRQLVKLGSEQGFTEGELSAAIELLIGVPNGGGEKEKKAGGFNPQEAGQRLVQQLQAAEGGAWTGQELQQKFNLSSATLHRRRKEFRIVYWRDAQHNFLYPRWQFTPTGASLAGIQEVLQLLQSHDEWRVMRYFLGKRAELGEFRPIDLLRRCELDKVLAHTKAHVEENTW